MSPVRSARLVAAALLCTTACRAGSEPAEHGTPPEHGGSGHAGSDTAHGGAPHAEPELIKIAPDMLRDLRVTTGKAVARAAGETVAALGELHVNEDAYAEVAAPVSARVRKLRARPGDSVAVGQILAELDSPELGEARAGLAAATLRLDAVRKATDRKRALAADRLITERELLEAEAQLADAQGASDTAGQALRRYSGAAGDTQLSLRSPIAGTVIERSIVVGQLADPSRTLFRIGDLSTLWLIAHVFERDAVRVQVNRRATASFAALPGKASEAIVQSIGREVDRASRTIAIRLDVANRDGVLRPGMSATASIPLGEVGDAQVLVVPATAVQRVGSAWAVFIPHGDAAFEARPIGRGRDLSGEVEVLSGLAAGDAVVVDGAFLLKAEADKARGGAEHED